VARGGGECHPLNNDAVTYSFAAERYGDGQLRLADFILADMENILVEWEAFAASQLPAASAMDSLELRDHAEEILKAVAKDIVQPQTPEEEGAKSRGQGRKSAAATETAAQTHALLRSRSGFDINQMTAEYRALRASVLRRWAAACGPAAPDVQDVIRFNEAIDQAIAESVARFAEQAEQARNFFLGMLGHDMRSPLSAIKMSAEYLSKLNAGETVSAAALRIIRSGSRMQALLDDLLDFNRTRFGLGISVDPTETDLARVFDDELQQLRAAHPDAQIELVTAGGIRGMWDENRMAQLLSNLVVNAIKYGDRKTPVGVKLEGRATEVVFEVINGGPRIAPSFLSQIFDPLKRGSEHQVTSGREGSMGLGLYIARGIATAHGGDISAKSEEGETVFRVRLPRRVPAKISQSLNEPSVERRIADRRMDRNK